MSNKDFVSLREQLKENRYLYFLAGWVRNLIHHGNLYLHSLRFVFAHKSDAVSFPVNDIPILENKVARTSHT